jgi:hypothetical protein
MSPIYRSARAAFGLSLLAGITLPNAALAQSSGILPSVPWPVRPAVVIDGPAGDPRTPLVYAAVAHWNQVLAGLGSGFRFGNVSTGGSAGSGAIRVVFSDATDFISNAARDSDRSAAVTIRGTSAPPLSLPNVARNVIFHELGHAIGVSHTSDPASVMCGRPAPCRPDLFASSKPHYFPLNGEDRAKLLAMYPASWKSR